MILRAGLYAQSTRAVEGSAFGGARASDRRGGKAVEARMKGRQQRSTGIAALLAACVALPMPSHAGDDYLCTVRAVYDLTDGGELANSPFGVGQRFSVNRETGVLTGGLEHPAWSRVTVLDRGSTEQSFKVVAVSTAEFPFLHYLEIREYTSGSVKPFSYTAGSLLRTGTCEQL